MNPAIALVAIVGAFAVGWHAGKASALEKLHAAAKREILRVGNERDAISRLDSVTRIASDVKNNI